MNKPTVPYIINGTTIIAWDNEYHDEEEPDKREYDNLLEYLCEEIGASEERNIIALAVDLAKYNNMTVGELFNTYQGDK